ncbi:MAG: InlB B-repeat-containing protein [Clostridia bacterium]|nr:InlB B-repeat-containing protein [Clostridia bacterium]
MKRFFVVFLAVISFVLSAGFLSACDETDAYKVTFDANGGELSFYSKTVSFGEELILPEGQKPGFKLACFTYEYGGKVIVFDGGEYLFRTGITVKAKWAPEDAYLINYDLNGGTLTSDAPFYYTGTEDVALIKPQKNEYFEGWRENESDTPDRDYVISEGSTGDKTFTAVFSKRVYNVNLVLTTTAFNPVKEGETSFVQCLYHGKTEQTFSVEYGRSLSLDVAVPVSANYEFVVWKYYDFSGDYVDFKVQGEEGAVVFNEYNFGTKTDVSVYVFCVGRNSPFI